MLNEDPIKCHRQSKIFNGKVVELQYAEWLELRGWKITNLEAWGANSDVQAIDSSGTLTAFEVKFIGIEDVEFKMRLSSLVKGSAAHVAFGPDSSFNFLLYRICEAEEQLAQFKGHRIAVVVIDEGDWVRLEVALNNYGIDWAHPIFLNSGQEWVREQKSYTKFLAALDSGSLANNLDKILILTRSHEYEYHLKFELPMSHTRSAL